MSLTNNKGPRDVTRTLLSISLALLVLVSACKKDDEPESKIPADATYDFVTVAASDHAGCLLTMRKVDDEPLIEYTSTYDLASASTHVSVGDRVIICYNPLSGTVYQSGPIHLYGYATLDNTEQSVQTPKEGPDDDWDKNPLTVQSIWRTGQYLNLQAQIHVTRAIKPKSFVLVADPETIDAEIVRLYMTYTNADGNDGDNPYGVNASFDLAPVWELPTCRSVQVNVPTTAGVQEYRFCKGF